MEFLKKHALPALALLIASGAIAAAVMARSAADRLKSELAAVRENADRRYEDLDAKFDWLERGFLKLRESGYVEHNDFSDISKRVVAATVLIFRKGDAPVFVGSSRLFTPKDAFPSEGWGSGFFVSADGLVVTARHVVGDEKELIIRTAAGEEKSARVLSRDEKTDIAILKIEGAKYPFLDLGYYNNVAVGEEVGVSGFSAGFLTPLVHRGVISGRGTDEKGGKIFTVNVFVNKGNSGGPVFSGLTGRVLGVMSARQRDATSEKFITLPAEYSSGIQLGSIDPIKFNVDLYNETVKLVSDVSQIGVGIASAADGARELLRIR